MIAMQTLSNRRGVEMSPFQSTLSIAFNIALLPLAVVVLTVFALREGWAPIKH